MAYSRIVGQNIELMMKKKNVLPEDLAMKLGFSLTDLHRIKEGVLLVDGNEIREIAEAIGIEFSELILRRDEGEYRELLHCMGTYHDVENKDKILDYIDMYIGIEEAKVQNN